MSINDPFRGVSAIFAARMRRGVGRHPALGEPLPRPAGRSLPAVTPAACASERLSRGRVFGRACPAEAAGHAPWDELHVQPWEHRAQGRGVGLNGAQKGSRRLVSSSGQSRLAGEHDQKDPTTHRGGVAIFCDCHADDAVFSPSPSSLASRCHVESPKPSADWTMPSSLLTSTYSSLLVSMEHSLGSPERL
jgi:hypothetical protein